MTRVRRQAQALLLAMQAPTGVPRSGAIDLVTDPMLPPQQIDDMLAHMWEEVYDLTPESHLRRLLSVVLGDAGAGMVRKRYAYQHMASILATMRFFDIDRFYADVFGVDRLVRERLNMNPYYNTADSDEWEALLAKDASYRARVEQFSRSIAWGATPTGMVMAASALLGTECKIYEAYTILDDPDAPEVPDPETEANTYGDIEGLGTYGSLQAYTYARLENRTIYFGRANSSRSEFVIRPLRPISDEEHYRMVRVLSRLKPAGTLMSIDSQGVEVHTPLPIRRVAADSTYWHVRVKTRPRREQADIYERTSDEGMAIEQPKPVFSYYQGESWYYNGAVTGVTSYTEDTDGNVVETRNQSQHYEDNVLRTFPPEQGLADQATIQAARSVHDGVLISSVGERRELVMNE